MCEKIPAHAETGFSPCPGDGKIGAAKIGGTKSFKNDIPWPPQSDADQRAQDLIRPHEFIQGSSQGMLARQPKGDQGLILASKFFWPLDMDGVPHFCGPDIFTRSGTFGNRPF
jgi:hypothetical protein